MSDECMLGENVWKRTDTTRTGVRTEAGYLLVPVSTEFDAFAERLDGVSALSTPVNVFANIDTSDSAFLEPWLC